MNLSELIPFLNRLETRPKKGLSQNFLIDSAIVEQIVQLADVQSRDFVLEIGPGPGALTAKLLERGARVAAVEMDSLFARELDRLQNGNLQVFQADFLKFPLHQFPPHLKIVANLPYHITTPILEKIFAHPFLSATLMVQKEVAERMQAPSGSKTFGSLSLFVQYHATIHSSFVVNPDCFYPKPTVDSTVIRLDSIQRPDIDPGPFFSLSRKAFQQRRKMLTSSLGLPKDPVRQVLASIGVRTDARPEDLSFAQWAALTKQLSKLFPQ